MTSFIIFLILYIQLPGSLMISKMKGSKEISSELLLQGFFFGSGILILEYFLFSALGIRLLFIVFSPVFAAVLIIKKLKKDKETLKIRKPSFDMNSLQFPAVLFVISIFTAIAQRYAFRDIESATSIYLNQDITWHISNVVALSRGFPFEDLRFSGLEFNYHYFNDLILGMCKYCFGMTASSLVLRCMLVLTAYIFSLGIYAFFREISSHAFFSTLVFLFSGAAITYFIMPLDEKYSIINYHIFSNINGVATSLAAVIAVWLFLSHAAEGPLKIRDIIIAVILTFSLTGLKGPCAAVLVAAMIAAAIIKVTFRHGTKNMIGITTASLVSFLATYILIIKGLNNMFRESNNNRAINLSIVKTFENTRLWDAFRGLAEHGGVFHIFIYCLCVFIIGSTVAAGLLFLVFLADTCKELSKIVRERKLPSTGVLLSIISGWVGLAGYWLVSQDGFSQMYFLFVAILFIVGESVRVLKTLDNKRFRISLSALVLINALFWGAQYIAYAGSTLVDDGRYFLYSDAVVDEASFLTHGELEGLEWLRNNSDKNSIIATDRLDLWNKEYPTEDSDCRCFYYSAFSERRFYLEGFSYSDVSQEEISEKLATNKSIFSEDVAVSQAAVTAAGVDYVIVTNRFSAAPGHFPAPVFTNGEISIFYF